MVLNVLNTIINDFPKTRKKVSKKTNNASEFKGQVANRVSGAMIIDELHDEINTEHKDIKTNTKQ